jgi:triosephosphate isomerase
MPRRPFIAGNWKMNLGPKAADELARGLKSHLVDQTAVDMAVFPAFPALHTVVQRLKRTGVDVGGQDLHPQTSGAFTGAVAGEMLRELGCTRVLVGHSERRSLFHDDDTAVRAKADAAWRAGLLPILCIGETRAEREGGQAQAVVERQLATALLERPADQVASVTLAYEPVWAIGTGLTATPAQAQDMHAHIRGWLRAHFPAFVAEEVRIQYGGSVKPGNAAALLREPDIDGALVGGASLAVDSFVAIVDAAAASR